MKRKKKIVQMAGLTTVAIRYHSRPFSGLAKISSVSEPVPLDEFEALGLIAQAAGRSP